MRRDGAPLYRFASYANDTNTTRNVSFLDKDRVDLVSFLINYSSQTSSPLITFEIFLHVWRGPAMDVCKGRRQRVYLYTRATAFFTTIYYMFQNIGNNQNTHLYFMPIF